MVYTITDSRKKDMPRYIGFALIAVMAVIAAVYLAWASGTITFAFASGTNAGEAAKTMFMTIVKIVCTIVMIIGVIFGVVGIAKFAIAHANEQSADQQKAILMLATGIILIILPVLINANSGVLSDIIVNATQ